MQLPQLHPNPKKKHVGAGRFELPTSRSRTVRSTKLSYAPLPAYHSTGVWRRQSAPSLHAALHCPERSVVVP